jgi:hypothetical protein
LHRAQICPTRRVIQRVMITRPRNRGRRVGRSRSRARTDRRSLDQSPGVGSYCSCLMILIR